MKNYEFRGWDESIKQYWFSNIFLNMVDPINKKSYYLYDSPISSNNLEIYSKLNDIKDNKIFQGDICEVIINNKRFNIEVIWDDDRAGLRLKGRYEFSHVDLDLTCDTILDNSILVIGNIHADKNLLSGKE
jgi:hypothetical protein